MLLVLLVAAVLPWLSGADPALRVFRARFGDRPATPEALHGIRAELDIAASPAAGVWQWLTGLARGDLGTSWVSGTPVGEQVVPAWWVSLNLATVSAAGSLLLAVLIVAPALRRAADGKSVVTRTLSGVIAALASLPTMVLAVALVGVIAVEWRLLPTSGWQRPRDMILPCLALALPMGAILARIMLGAINSTAQESWLLTWRANGCRRRRLVVAIAHRAVAVVVPQVFLIIAGTIGAAVVIEKIFAIPGLGRLTLHACLAQDVPVVQATMAMLVLAGLVLGVAGALTHRALLGPTLAAGHGAQLSTGQRSGRRFGPGALAGCAALAVLVLGGLPRSPAIDVDAAYLAPSWQAPLGTDGLGRDLWARAADGALISIGLAVLCSAICLVAGTIAGLANPSGQPGIADVLNAVPAVFMGIILAAVVGPGLATATLAVCAVGWIPIAVHARTLAGEIRATGFYRTGLLSGGGRWWMLRKHLIPVALPQLLMHALVRLPHVALALTGLSFIGIGAPHDSPEWGKLLAESVGHVDRAPWLTAVPTVGLLLVGVLASLLGEQGE